MAAASVTRLVCNSRVRAHNHSPLVFRATRFGCNFSSPPTHYRSPITHSRAATPSGPPPEITLQTTRQTIPRSTSEHRCCTPATQHTTTPKSKIGYLQRRDHLHTNRTSRRRPTVHGTARRRTVLHVRATQDTNEHKRIPPTSSKTRPRGHSTVCAWPNGSTCDAGVEAQTSNGVSTKSCSACGWSPLVRQLQRTAVAEFAERIATVDAAAVFVETAKAAEAAHATGRRVAGLQFDHRNVTQRRLNGCAA